MPVAQAERVAAAATMAVNAIIARRTAALSVPPLLDYIPQLSPRFSAPTHLHELVKVIESTETQPVRRVVSLPPQHGKSESVLHGLVWLLKRNATRTHVYATYSAKQARSKADRFQQIAAEAQLAPGTLANLDEWRTPEGGGLLATSVEGPLTGQGCDGVMIIDDPVKDRIEAESSLQREQVWAWWQNVARTRLHPEASVLVVMTRWHPDDLAGRLLDSGWEYLRLPAIDDQGEPLWPDKFPLSYLRETETDVGEYTWASLYQGNPRSKGAHVFRDAYFYDALPETGYREGIGLDFAYTAKKRSDYSVAILGRRYSDLLYILDVQRYQIESPAFANRVRLMREHAPGARLLAFIGGTERGTIDFFQRTEKIHVTAIPAAEDKFVRAQTVAAMWNAGKVLLPRKADWLDSFITEICAFTGVSDLHDDQVDALAGAERATSGAGFGAWE